MNILTKIRLINELNEKELKHGTDPEASWHTQYKDSAWIYAGNMPYTLTEGKCFKFVNDFYIRVKT
jgi:RNA-binding motif X-linked protein 2